jgi:nitroreductase
VQIDDFLELVRRRRSVRRFKPDPIPDADIEKILEAGRWAMSGSNGQPWEFIVVKSREKREEIARVLVADPELVGEVESLESTRIEAVRHQAGRTGGSSQFRGWPPDLLEAPVMIVVCADRRTFQATVLATHFLGGEGGHQACFYKNMANATQNMHLAAAALGLGSQWKSIGRVQEYALRPVLNLPPVLEIHTIVIVGHPAAEPPPSTRRELKEIVHYEKYDRSKYRTGADIVKWLADLRQKMAG